MVGAFCRLFEQRAIRENCLEVFCEPKLLQRSENQKKNSLSEKCVSHVCVRVLVSERARGRERGLVSLVVTPLPFVSMNA